ncbi:hypothetical protein [Corynebacterium pseudotuberculosis]|uniref:hypothetical protein n=1 Tax=Corynebacterium pseudotuberculosis TaxID=1719 RepID=UPI00097682CF|nr:hypothetical protein [Corynebacterium pseudotuberculosis]OMH65238.1 hypothetical protein BFG02_10505 [Corynebacterium pseudotuberculosis]
MTNPMGCRKAARAITSTRETHITPKPIGIKKLTIRIDSTLHTAQNDGFKKKKLLWLSLSMADRKLSRERKLTSITASCLAVLTSCCIYGKLLFFVGKVREEELARESKIPLLTNYVVRANGCIVNHPV